MNMRMKTKVYGNICSAIIAKYLLSIIFLDMMGKSKLDSNSIYWLMHLGNPFPVAFRYLPICSCHLHPEETIEFICQRKPII